MNLPFLVSNAARKTSAALSDVAKNALSEPAQVRDG